MAGAFQTDEELVRRLPLPLAQLYRRAANAKTPLERHLTSYYLWEAAIKLLGSVAVIGYVETAKRDPEIDERVGTIARASIGQWWELIRRLTTALGDAGDAKFKAIKDLLLGRARDDMPRCAGLDSALREALDGSAAARSTVRLNELLDRLIQYRNREVGHGAAGRRGNEFYEKMARAMYIGAAELFGRLDLLAGRRLVFISDVSRHPSGDWLLDRFELLGETVRRAEPLHVPESAGASLPNPDRLYLMQFAVDTASGSGASAQTVRDEDANSTAPPLQSWCMQPLLGFDADAGEVLFFSTRRGKGKLEYLSYCTGRTAERDAVPEKREPLSAIFGGTAHETSATSDAPTEAASEAEDTVKSIGEFELLSLLGKGGMGVVYRAWQPSLGRQVALKCLLRSDDPKAEARFTREIHALGRVEHPHLVKVFTSGSAGDQWFYAMELVEGTTLAAVCDALASRKGAVGDVDLDTWQNTFSQLAAKAKSAESPISKTQDAAPPVSAPADEKAAMPASSSKAQAAAAELAALGHRSYVRHVVELIRQIAQASHELHEAGVIHRDIKPGNVMLTSGGRYAVLMDLGLAQISDETDDRLTRTRQFVGTLRYASPEQVLAVGNLDRRSDIYSLGATLWEMLTLHPIYDANEQLPMPELMRRIQYQEPDRPRKFHPGIPRDLEAIALKCLEKDRTRRYPTAEDLADDLERWLEGEPVRAQPPTVTYVLGKFARKHWPAITATAALLLLLALAAVLAVGQIARARNQAVKSAHDAQIERDIAQQQKTEADQQKAEAERQKTEAEKQRANALAQEDIARHSQYFSQIRLAQEAFSANEIGGAVNILDSLSAWMRPGDNLQSWEWHYLRGLTRTGFQTLRGHKDIVTSVAFSPDGKSIATGSSDKTAIIWDVATGKPRITCEGNNNAIRRLAFSPDGASLATIGSDKTLCIFNTMDGSIVKKITGLNDPGIGGQLAFSPDGQRIFVGGWNAFSIIDVSSGALTLQKAIRGSISIAISPDQKTIACGGVLGTLSLLDETGSTKKILSKANNSAAAVSAVVFSPDGRRLAVGQNSGQITVFDLTAPDPVATVWIQQAAHRDQISGLSFSPDGGELASCSFDGSLKIWDVLRRKESAFAKGHTGSVTSVAFSPNGATIATGSFDKTARLWRVNTWDWSGNRMASRIGGPAFTGGNEATGMRISCDGRWIGMNDSIGVLEIWDSASGRVQLINRTMYNVPNFSPTDPNIFVAADFKGHVSIIDVRDGKIINTFPTSDEKPIRFATFTGDGSMIATATINDPSHNINLWDAKTGKLVRSFAHDTEPEIATFIPNGRWALSGGVLEGWIYIWDTKTAELEFSLPASRASAIATSPDKRSIAVASHNGEVLLFHIPSKEPMILTGHYADVNDVSFSPDGQRLASCGKDGSVKIWDAASGHQIMTLDAHDCPVVSVRFAPDGYRLISCGLDGGIRDWNAALIDIDIPPTNGPLLAERGTMLANMDSWPESLADFDSAIAAGFDEAWIHDYRGLANGVLGRFADAQREMAMGVDHGDADLTWLDLVSILDISQGDLDSYRRHSDLLLETLQKTQFIDSLVSSSVGCLIMGKDAVPDLTVPQQMIEKIMKAHGPNYHLMLVDAGLLYRMGKYQQCIDMENQAADIFDDAADNSATFFDDAPPKTSTRPSDVKAETGSGWTYIFTAMSEQQLGHPAEARAYLAKTKIWMDENHPKVPRLTHEPRIHNQWQNVLALNLLYQEASNLIGANP